MSLKKSLHFTLIELFVVLTVMVIMFAVLSPMFKRMGAANKVNTAIRVLGSNVNLARQYSQTKGSYVALIMPGNNATYSSPCDLPDKYKFAIYRLASVTFDGTNFTFSAWIEDGKWQFLPSGVSIMEADEDRGIFGALTTPPLTDFVKLPEDNNIVTILDVPFENPLVDSICAVIGDNVRAIIFGPNGKPMPNSFFSYITVGEASWNPLTSEWNIVNPAFLTTNISSANQMTIEINGFTGGVTYTSPEKY